MSIRFQADNDLNRLIVSATFRREPTIDFQSARAAQLDYLDDEEVLKRAASEDRILVTHDKRTMPKHFASFLAKGNTALESCWSFHKTSRCDRQWTRLF